MHCLPPRADPDARDRVGRGEGAPGEPRPRTRVTLCVTAAEGGGGRRKDLGPDRGSARPRPGSAAQQKRPGQRGQRA